MQISEVSNYQKEAPQQNHNQMDNTEDFISKDDRFKEDSSFEQVSESGERTRRRGNNKQSTKQLTVQNVYPDGTVQCNLVCKQKSVNFKFNRFDTLPSDIIEGMIQEDCLKPGSHKFLVEQLQSIIKQLQENPNEVPECTKYVQKVCTYTLFFFLFVSTIYYMMVLFMLLLENKVRHSSLTRQTQKKTHRRYRSVSCIFFKSLVLRFYFLLANCI